jgi:hypothetical protein
LPSRAETKAIVFPSGDTEGEWLPPDAVVSCRLSVPSVEILAICVVVPLAAV